MASIQTDGSQVVYTIASDKAAARKLTQAAAGKIDTWNFYGRMAEEFEQRGDTEAQNVLLGIRGDEIRHFQDLMAAAKKFDPTIAAQPDPNGGAEGGGDYIDPEDDD